MRKRSVRSPAGAGRGGTAAAWMAVMACMLMVGGAQAGFQRFDDFEDELIGPLNGQDGWHSAGGDNRVVVDPAGGSNQVLYVPADSSILYKSLAVLSVPDGDARMLFLRLRVGEKQTFSVGLSHLSSPSEYSDFGPELGMASSGQNLDFRVWDNDNGNYEVVAQLLPDTWYNLWVRVDTTANAFRAWLHADPGTGAGAANLLSASDSDDTFSFRAGTNSPMVSFYMKTSGGGSSENFGPVYIDDIHLETTSELNLTNPIPEPASLALLAICTLAMASRRR